MTRHVLMIDDDAAFRKAYARLLTHAGFEVTQAHDRPSAWEAFGDTDAQVILLDLMLPPDGSVKGGMEMLGAFIAQRPGIKVVVVSGVGDTRFMVQAVRQGAYDFITKPADPDVVQVVVERAAARAALESQVDRLRQELQTRAPGSTMIGQAESFLAAKEMALRVAHADLPILITGENGTGKELMMRLIHEHSPRAKGELVMINCGALPPNLLESTLFGHKKGAFTGAIADRPGLFVQAHGGTLCLDEIGDMPLALQVKLLRVLEAGEIFAVGSDRPTKVDVRILSATNRDLAKMQQEHEFREDLYWRINGAEIRLPPLRHRTDDLELLATHFLHQSASMSIDGQARTLSPGALGALQNHAWPGNLRELRHAMSRATVLSGTRQTLMPEDFSFAPAAPPPGPAIIPDQEGATLAEKIEALERREIARALSEHEGNRTQTAQALGLSRQGLINKIERHGFQWVSSEVVGC